MGQSPLITPPFGNFRGIFCKQNFIICPCNYLYCCMKILLISLLILFYIPPTIIMGYEPYFNPLLQNYEIVVSNSMLPIPSLGLFQNHPLLYSRGGSSAHLSPSLIIGRVIAIELGLVEVSQKTI